ncbi:hypothetical protein IJH02_00130 [Candidatus Saccharibacteria bacterium]|nr:hypothetical protein [Candidatus Saccharibacteria bacterium]
MINESAAARRLNVVKYTLCDIKIVCESRLSYRPLRAGSCRSIPVF